MRRLLPAPAHGRTPTRRPKSSRSRFRERFKRSDKFLLPRSPAARRRASAPARNSRLPYPQLGEPASFIPSPPAVTRPTQGILPKTGDAVRSLRERSFSPSPLRRMAIGFQTFCLPAVLSMLRRPLATPGSPLPRRSRFPSAEPPGRAARSASPVTCVDDNVRQEGSLTTGLPNTYSRKARRVWLRPRFTGTTANGARFFRLHQAAIVPFRRVHGNEGNPVGCHDSRHACDNVPVRTKGLAFPENSCC